MEERARAELDARTAVRPDSLTPAGETWGIRSADTRELRKGEVRSIHRARTGNSFRAIRYLRVLEPEVRTERHRLRTFPILGAH